MALDPGTKRIGVAICDELRITTRPHEVITLESWKKLLASVKTILAEFDAKVQEAHLFTTSGDWRWKQGSPLKATQPTFSDPLPTSHDRPKVRATTGAQFLTKLGVTAADGLQNRI